MQLSFKQRYPSLPLKYMFQICEIAGVPILVHLSTFIFLGFFTMLALFWAWPFLVLELLCLALIFFHELGHYYSRSTWEKSVEDYSLWDEAVAR